MLCTDSQMMGLTVLRHYSMSHGGPRLSPLCCGQTRLVSAGLFFHLRSTSRWIRDIPKCPVSISKEKPIWASDHSWNATPAPIVLRKLRRKSWNALYCCVRFQPVVCVVHLCDDFSQLCSYTTRGSTSISFPLHTDAHRRQAFVCSCYLRPFPCRTPWLHTSPAGKWTCYFV